MVANAIRAKGYTVLPMAVVYPDGLDQTVGDEEWIQMASNSGWIALTKDYSIIRDHANALANSTLRVFALTKANLTGSEMAERYIVNLDRILQYARKPGPYVFAVKPVGLELRWPIP